MVNENFLYRVYGFVPPEEKLSMGMYGFSVRLDREFAKKLKQEKVGEEVQNRFNEMGKELVISRLFKEKYTRSPYNFVDDSLLIQSIIVSGDACEIGVDWSQLDSLDKDDKYFSNYIEYNPHNVDCMKQAFGLLSLFSKWIEYAEAAMIKF